tara:strand:+ start:996 stop:1280 length:285 start_codon:yes stop_codon:yes gene_type:complete
MIKNIKELQFDENDVATLLFDNGLMATIDFVPAVLTVSPAIAEGYVTRVADISGTVLQTKYWTNREILITFLNFTDKLSIQDIPSQLTTTISEI